MRDRFIYLTLVFLCGAILFTYFRKTPPPPLGKDTLTLDIPATAYWINTEVYLHKEDRLQVSASGSWDIYPNTESLPTGPEGNLKDQIGPCHGGELGGYIGLTPGDDNLLCIGKEKIFTAKKDGFLYLGAVDDGEREDNSGSVKVVLTGTLKTKQWPSIAINDLTDKKIEELTQNNIKTIELIGHNIILTLPTQWNKVVAPTVIKAIMDRIDGFYDAQKDLTGAVPHNGQKIRIVLFEDASRDLYDYSGNPIFMSLSSTELPEILNQKSEDYPFAYAYKIGYTFEEIFPHYNNNFKEVWPQIFSIYTLEKFKYDLILHYKDWITEQEIKEYLQNGTYNDLKEETYLGIAMLMEIRERYGWAPFKDFFRFMKKNPTPPGLDDAHQWSWIRDAFLKSSNTNLTSFFKKWHVPLTDQE